MAIEIVDLPSKNSGFSSSQTVSLLEGNQVDLVFVSENAGFHPAFLVIFMRKTRHQHGLFVG